MHPPHSPDTSYIRKWLGEAAALVSSVKIPQTIQISSGVAFPSNLSSTPPLTSHPSTTPPLTDSHMSSTPPLTDSQMSLTPPFSVPQMPLTPPITSSFFPTTHISADQFSSSPILTRLTSTPPSAYFPSTPPPSASYIHSSNFLSYLSSAPPHVATSYVPSTPPPSAEYFPSTPPPSTYLLFGSERGGVLSTDALRHSQLLQAKLAELAAARSSPWPEENDIQSTSINISSPVFVSTTTKSEMIKTGRENSSLVDNYNTWTGKTSDNKTDKTLDWRIKEIQNESPVHDKSLSEEYSSFKYTPETKIPESYEKQNDLIKFSSENTESEAPRSFLGLSVSKPIEYVQKESDWSISNRVKSIFEDIKKNAISDFVKQRELDESMKEGAKLQDDKTKGTQFTGDWWTSLTDRNKIAEDLENKTSWGYNEINRVSERNTDLDDLMKSSSESQTLDDKMAVDLEMKILDEEVAQAMKSNANWMDNGKISPPNKHDDLISKTNARNITKTADNSQYHEMSSSAEIHKDGVTPPISEQKEIDHKNKGVTIEEATFKRSGREGRRGSDGGSGRVNRGSRGDTPPLSRESRGSFKRARRGSGEGGSPVGGGAMVEECIIRPRVEAEKSNDEEVPQVTVSTELLREGSEFSKTLKGVQTEMDSLTRLTDNVFEEVDKTGDNTPTIVSQIVMKSLNERPKVLGGENGDEILVSDSSAATCTVSLSSSESRKSWAGIDSGSRETKSDCRDSRDSDKSSISTSSSRSDMESESTKRVRAYLESLSARIKQQIPYSSSSDSHNSSSTAPSSRLVSMSSSETPPTSARLMSYSSSETPPSSACPMSVSSSETPPNSADAVAGTPGARPSLTESPTSSAFFGSTPPHSAGLSSSTNMTVDALSLMAGDGAIPAAGLLQRATSCDSINSDTSITLGELEEAAGQVTAQLSTTLIYDA